jgi:hypothetical protein
MAVVNPRVVVASGSAAADQWTIESDRNRMRENRGGVVNNGYLFLLTDEKPFAEIPYVWGMESGLS